jgi:hypothetical protein
MDLIMYILYSGDQVFVRDMMTRVVNEVADEHQCEELRGLLSPCLYDRPQLYRCLFFLLLDCHAKFRFWVLEDKTTGLHAVCPHKAARFLHVLRSEIVPRFLINETVYPDELERELKVEYLRS